MPQFTKTVKGIMTTEGLAGIEYSAIVDAPNIEQIISDATTNTEGIIYQELAKKLDATDGIAPDSKMLGGQAPEYYATTEALEKFKTDVLVGNEATDLSLEALNNNKAPTNHASTATTYGTSTEDNYGHVKLSDSTSLTSSASEGVAATPTAVKATYDYAKSEFDKRNMKVYTSFEQLGFTGIRGSDGYLNSNCPTPKQVFDAMPEYSMLIMLTNQDNNNLKNYWTNLPANRGFIEFVKIHYNDSTSTGRSRLTFWDTTTNVGYISSVTANIPDGITWNKMLTAADFAVSESSGKYTLTINLD